MHKNRKAIDAQQEAENMVVEGEEMVVNFSHPPLEFRIFFIPIIANDTGKWQTLQPWRDLDDCTEYIQQYYATYKHIKIMEVLLPIIREWKK